MIVLAALAPGSTARLTLCIAGARGVFNLAVAVAEAVAEEQRRVDASIAAAMEAVGEALGVEQHRRDAAHSRLKAELHNLLDQIKQSNAERKNQTEKFFILLAELRVDVAELTRAIGDLNRRSEAIVRQQPLRRLDG